MSTAPGFVPEALDREVIDEIFLVGEDTWDTSRGRSDLADIRKRLENSPIRVTPGLAFHYYGSRGPNHPVRLNVNALDGNQFSVGDSAGQEVRQSGGACMRTTTLLLALAGIVFVIPKRSNCGLLILAWEIKNIMCKMQAGIHMRCPLRNCGRILKFGRFYQ